MTRFSPLPALFCVALLLGACAPTLNTRGNFLENDRLQDLQSGVSSQKDIETKLGTPTVRDPFDKSTWFYIGEKTETTAFFNPKVTDRRVIKVQFDDVGMLSSISEVDEKAGKDVALVGKTTRSSGQQMNAFQQFLGNLGKFNANQMNSGSAPGR